MYLFAEVVLPLPIKGTFTYTIPTEEKENIAIGCRVLVPFGGKKIYTGIVFDIHQQAPTEYIPKNIISILDKKTILHTPQIQFWKWLSEYYLCSLGDIYRLAFPASLKLESETYISLKPNAEIDYQNLDANELYLIQNLEVRSIINLKEIEAFIPRKNIIATIKSLMDMQYIIIDEKVTEKYNAKEIKYIKLKNREQTFENLHHTLAQLKKAHKQKEILLHIVEHETINPNSPLKKSELHSQIAFSQTQLNALIDKNIIEEYSLQESRITQYEGDTEKLEQLSPEQKKAIEEINHAIEQEKNILLHGVTASGKTHIYTEKIKHTINNGKTILYLVPEIALAKQIINRLEKKYGKTIAGYHAKLSDYEKVEIWQKIIKGEIKIIIGTRTAIFLPIQNLGMIIVDEEHDSNYRQRETTPYFHAKDAAIILGKIHKCPVILGSATPSVESYYLALKEKITPVYLNQRYNNIEQPTFEIQYIKEQQEAKKMSGNFSINSLEKIKNTIEQKKQVIVIHNKRGYSSVIECQTCGFVSYCSNCDVVMTYHKTPNELKCHYCGHRASKPTECPKCSSKNLSTKGIGVEKIHEELQNIFPNYEVDRMDIDAMRKKFAYEKLYEKIKNNETQIIVGTQMLAKGLDFQAVDLAVIPRIDHLLYIQDFRAEEKTYQLIQQIAGRTGRYSGKGKIIIQTQNPNHQIFIHTKNTDQKNIYQYLLNERKKFNYPPYTRLIMIEFKHRNQEKTKRAIQFLANSLKNILPQECILGPEKAPIAKLNLLYQYQILLKLPKKNFINMKKNIENALDEIEKIDAYKSIKKHIYVDY